MMDKLYSNKTGCQAGREGEGGWRYQVLISVGARQRCERGRLHGCLGEEGGVVEVMVPWECQQKGSLCGSTISVWLTAQQQISSTQ